MRRITAVAGEDGPYRGRLRGIPPSAPRRGPSSSKFAVAATRLAESPAPCRGQVSFAGARRFEGALSRGRHGERRSGGDEIMRWFWARRRWPAPRGWRPARRLVRPPTKPPPWDRAMTRTRSVARAVKETYSSRLHICDPHHHCGTTRRRYLSTTDRRQGSGQRPPGVVEASMYRAAARGDAHGRETEFVGGGAAMSRSGVWPTRVAAGIVSSPPHAGRGVAPGWTPHRGGPAFGPPPRGRLGGQRPGAQLTHESAQGL